MVNSSLKSTKWFVSGLVFVVLAFCCLPGSTDSQRKAGASGTKGRAARSLAGIPGPTKSTPYWCEFTLNNNKGTANINFEYTRRTPGNGWVGMLHNRYERNGGTLDEGIQLFNSQPVYNQLRPNRPPRLVSTQWDFQDTNGKVTCKLFVSKEGGELKFSNCSNGAIQYCISERLVDAVIEGPCGSCNASRGPARANCFLSCLKPKAENMNINPMDCEQFPVSCFSFLVIRFTPTDLITASTRTKYEDALIVLDLMHKEWIDFVNRALGPCTTSTYCPGGTNCGPDGECHEIFKF